MSVSQEVNLYRLKALLIKNWWLKKHHGYLGIGIEILFPVVIVRHDSLETQELQLFAHMQNKCVFLPTEALQCR